MSQQVPKPSNETQYNRACDACRQHKVRCLPDTSPTPSSSKVCQRCARTDRRCVFTAPQKRKQRKRTDTRVAELEREIQAMRALFEGKKPKIAERQLHALNEETNSQENSPDGLESRKYTSCFGTPPSQVWTGLTGTGQASKEFCPHPSYFAPADPLISQDKDAIERGVISEELATQLFNTFVKDLAPHSPLVVFPPGTSANEIRQKKPTLFLAVISAAAGKSDPSLFSILSSEVLTAYTRRTVINSEKSLELIQSMLITSVWYYPPGKFAQLKFYEYIHAAATMAMDIGIGTKPTINRRRRGQPDNESPQSASSTESDLDDLEKKRTFLSCYLVTTGVAMSMRRPSMLRFNSWVAECLEILSTSPLALPTDPMFCHWVKLMVIAEDVYTSFSFDDESNCANLSETRVQFMLKSFEKRLENWYREITPEMDSDVLRLSYFYANMYSHEIAIHDEHPPEDFRPPFRIDKPLVLQSEIKLTSAHIDSIAAIISNAHAMLDLLLNQSIATLRAVPIYNYVRMAYSCIILTKLYTSTRCPSSQIGPVLNRDNLKIGFYLKALIARLTEAVGPMECRSPYTFLGLLMRLQDWFLTQEAQDHWASGVDLFTEKTPMTPPLENATAMPELSDLMSTSMSAIDVYPLDPSEQEMANMGLKDGFNKPSTAYVPQITEHFQFSPPMGVNFMDPFQLFDGLDSMGGEINDWAANMDLSAEWMPGAEGLQDWNFDANS